MINDLVLEEVCLLTAFSFRKIVAKILREERASEDQIHLAIRKISENMMISDDEV